MPKEQQHYVPRFLLKNFTRGKKPKIFVYDKSNDKRFQTNIRNVAAEKGFYELEVDDKVWTLESGLSRLEDETATILKKLVKERNVKALDEDEVTMLGVFLAVQLVRTKEHRLKIEHARKLLAESLQEVGASEENIKELLGSQIEAPEDKLIGFKSVLEAKELVPLFLDKAWVLLETTRKHPFFISDNPLVLQNNIDHGPRGSLGLAVRGIEIYLPISTTFCLSLLCPSRAEELLKVYEKMVTLDQVLPGWDGSVEDDSEVTRAQHEGLMNGTPIKMKKEMVTRINSLQVMQSSRFVYCETDTFELVEEMISDDDGYREGLKMTIA